MRVLAHIHTFNDADIIDRTIEAVRTQTRPVDELVIVDNASRDATLDQPSVKHATVLRQKLNGGTSGAVHAGFRYALVQNYDCIWVFDADSLPEPAALEKLLALYASFPASVREETAYLACLHYNVQDGISRHGAIFNDGGFAPANPGTEEPYYPCDVVIWSGCLYRLAAVRRIGLPNADYMLDWGEFEYGYRVMKAGYKGFIHQGALLQHNIRGYTSIKSLKLKIGPMKLPVHEFAPIRCYYTCRNMVYFALYDFAEQRLRLLRKLAQPMGLLILGFVLRPRHHGKEIAACVRGLWHGVTGNIATRY
jgi:GT2 family glycosyltransferase